VTGRAAMLVGGAACARFPAMPRRRTLVAVVLLLTIVVGAHAALWASPRMPEAMKWRLTLLNAAGWAVVLLPAVGVALWARAHRDRRGGRGPDGGR